MESNYHLELATTYLKLQERQRKASKTYYEKHRERLINLNLDDMNEINETEEYKETRQDETRRQLNKQEQSAT